MKSPNVRVINVESQEWSAALPNDLNPTPESGAHTRRELLRRMLAGVGASIVGPMVARAHPIYRHLADSARLEDASAKAMASDWSPQFLDSHQNESLIVLSDAISPGSAKAQVNRVIDLLLSVETKDDQKMFKAALAALDADAMKHFGNTVVRLSAAQLDELLSKCSAQESEHLAEHDDSAAAWKTNQKLEAQGPPNLRDHFENLKGWIVATYYSSEEGMRELGWTEDYYFDKPAACTHLNDH